MLIDPFVVIAQIINFLILVALLKRFLYKPITQAMATRSQRIERQLAAAAAQEQDAEREKQLYRQKQQELEAQKQQWLEQAKQEVEQEQQKLWQKGQAEVNLAKIQWYESLEQNRVKFALELRDRLSQQVMETTRKALADLANANLEAQIIERLIDRLEHLDRSQLEAMRGTPISHSRRLITIRSSFTIADDQSDRLIAVIREQIAADAEVQFETVADLICGIELRDRDYKISWNLEDYLAELEASTAKFIRENQIK